jgi:glyoxylase-like metal-dependent hydrolase (beta-lactamase superfamily II)
MKVQAISCGSLKIHHGEMFNNLPVERVRQYYSLDGDGSLKISMNALIVEYKERVILFDPGCADFLPARLRETYGYEFPASLEEALSAAGYDPGQVTDVIFTHLHFDHGSGAFQRVPGKIQKRFEDARYHVLKAHYQYACNPHQSEVNTFFASFFKYVDQVHWLEEWSEDWIRFKIFYGHTKGLVVPRIITPEQEIYYVSDLIPMEIFMEPDVNSGYDLDPDLLLNEKRQFLKGINTPSEILFFHDPLKDRIFYP